MNVAAKGADLWERHGWWSLTPRPASLAMQSTSSARSSAIFEKRLPCRASWSFKIIQDHSSRTRLFLVSWSLAMIADLWFGWPVLRMFLFYKPCPTRSRQYFLGRLWPDFFAHTACNNRFQPISINLVGKQIGELCVQPLQSISIDNDWRTTSWRHGEQEECTTRSILNRQRTLPLPEDATHVQQRSTKAFSQQLSLGVLELSADFADFERQWDVNQSWGCRALNKQYLDHYGPLSGIFSFIFIFISWHGVLKLQALPLQWTDDCCRDSRRQFIRRLRLVCIDHREDMQAIRPRSQSSLPARIQRGLCTMRSSWQVAFEILWYFLNTKQY